MSKRPTIFVIEECREGEWVPCSPGNGSEVIAALKRLDPGDENDLTDTRNELSEQLGLPVRIAKYTRKDL